MADNGAYVTPDENVVNEFMQDISEESTLASYEVADKQTVAGLMSSLKRKQTLNGLTAGKLTYLYHDKGNKKLPFGAVFISPKKQALTIVSVTIGL